jgi:hypothetical protein
MFKDDDKEERKKMYKKKKSKFEKKVNDGYEINERIRKINNLVIK